MANNFWINGSWVPTEISKPELQLTCQVRVVLLWETLSVGWAMPRGETSGQESILQLNTFQQQGCPAYLCLDFSMFSSYLKYGYKAYEVKSPKTLAHKTSVNCLTKQAWNNDPFCSSKAFKGVMLLKADFFPFKTEEFHLYVSTGRLQSPQRWWERQDKLAHCVAVSLLLLKGMRGSYQPPVDTSHPVTFVTWQNLVLR